MPLSIFNVSLRYHPQDYSTPFHAREDRTRTVGIAIAAGGAYEIIQCVPRLQYKPTDYIWEVFFSAFVSKLHLHCRDIEYAHDHGQCVWPCIRPPQPISVASLPIFWRYADTITCEYTDKAISFSILGQLFASFPFVRDDVAANNVNFGHVYEKHQVHSEVSLNDLRTLLNHLVFTVYGFNANTSSLYRFDTSSPYIVDVLQVFGYTTLYQERFIAAESEAVIYDTVARINAGRTSYSIADMRVKEVNGSNSRLATYTCPPSKSSIVIVKDVIHEMVQELIQDMTKGLGGLYYGDSSFPYGTPENPLICPPRK